MTDHIETSPARPTPTFQEALVRLWDARVIRLLFLGFSAGLPILLIFSTLSLWLREAGMERSAVTYFSWAALGYSFKFVWAPLVDRLPVPVLTAWLGRRRGWLLLSQLAAMLAIFMTGQFDPSVQSLAVMTAICAVGIGFSSATQDIVIDAYRIECAPPDMQPLLSSVYIVGYRIGMIAAGAGALYLADFWGTEGEYVFSAWQQTYAVMAALMGVGILTTFLSPEPPHQANLADEILFRATEDYIRFFILCILSIGALIGSYILLGAPTQGLRDLLANVVSGHVAGFIGGSVRMLGAIAGGLIFARLLTTTGLCSWAHIQETYIAPIEDFFQRYAKVAIWILVLIGTYRIADIVMGVIANPFYQDMGFSKTDIANISKVWGLFATIIGGLVGGAVAFRVGVIRLLFVGAVLAAASNLLFAWMALQEMNTTYLAMVITADNFSGGLASAAFVAYLSSLTNIQFTATQYALFTSLMTLFPKILGGYSGSFVDAVGYPSFFVGTAILGIPVLFIILYVANRVKEHTSPEPM